MDATPAKDRLRNLKIPPLLAFARPAEHWSGARGGSELEVPFQDER